nr:reverse transcriptase domain-containing protein [Tanacetum cinerariifolium]
MPPWQSPITPLVEGKWFKFKGGTFIKRRTEECYDLIEKMTAHHNDCDTSGQQITPNCETYGGPHSYSDCPAIVVQTQNIYDARSYQSGIKETIILRGTTKEETISSKELPWSKPTSSLSSTSLSSPGLPSSDSSTLDSSTMNTASSSGSKTLLGNTITNPKEDLNDITTRSGTAYQGPMIATTSSSLPQVVECETEVTKDTVPPTNNGSTKDIQPPVVQDENLILNSEPVVAPIIEPIVAPVNDQKEKIFQIFQDLNFNISFADALILMPKFGPAIKTLLTNKDKLSELARTSLNEHCSAVLLKKLPEKLEDPGKFLIPCDFSRMDECLALANLGARINLIPLSVWNQLSLPELSPTYMTLELVDCLISRPVGVAEDFFVKVGTFHFLADFVVVDFDANPRVPLILGRSFLKTGRAVIDAFEGELTLCVGKEAITFNLDQTLRYSANYNDMTGNGYQRKEQNRSQKRIKSSTKWKAWKIQSSQRQSQSQTSQKKAWIWKKIEKPKPNGAGYSFIYDPALKSFNEVQIIFNPPPQSHYKIYLCQLCESNSHFAYECSQRVPLAYEPELCYNQSFGDNDYPYDSPAIAITLDLPIVEPKDSLRMGDEHLDTIPETKSDELIKPSVENLVPSPSESKDLYDSECDVPACDDFTTFSNLLFDADADDDFSSKSMLNHDSSIISFSLKIDYLLDEFDDELILLESIPSGTDEADCDPEEEICLIEKLFGPFMEEIDLTLTPDNSMPPGIKEDDYDSERDILIFEELLSNDSLSFSENESFHFDIPSSLRPPVKPQDDDEIEPNSGILTVKVVGDISEYDVPMPRLLPIQPTLASNQEKSPHLLSHRGFKAFQPSSECPVMIY